MTSTPFFPILLLAVLGACECFTGIGTPLSAAKRRSCIFAALLEEDAYTKSFLTIDKCAFAGVPSDDLYDAVRYVDRNASKLYPDESAKGALWKRAYGSWKLQLATGPPARGGTTPFKTVPIFAYAMIDENNGGMGLKKKPADFSNKKGSRMPAFTIIGSSEKSLIARGGSGGIAIWTRLDKDIRPAAYGVE